MNRVMRRLVWGVVVVGLAGGASLVRAADPVMSRWRNGDVRVDGVMSDWPGVTFVSKEVSTSVVNDAEDLYVLVATRDPRVSLQLQRAGLEIYLDSKGGKGQTFGIRIPPLGSRLAPGNAPAGGARGDDEAPVLSYFDVIGPGGDEMRRVELAEGTGIDLRIGTEDGMTFVELKVPFAASAGHPYAPGLSLTKGDVGLGIVTPDPPRVARAGGMRGGGSGGMMLGPGARPPGEAKGKAINLWTKIVLAKSR